MVIATLAIGLIVLVVFALVGKLFSLMLTCGLLIIVGGLLAKLAGSISMKAFYLFGGVGLLVALGSFLLLL